MVRRTLLTFATRFGIALLNFGVVLLTARYLGAAGRGHVSLLITDCALLLLFIGLVGGSSLIYLAPRRNVWRLLVPAAAWAVIVCIGGAGLIWLGRDVPVRYARHVAGLSLVQAFYSIVSALLLGRRRESLFNVLNLTQVGLLVAGLLIGFFGLGIRRVEVFYAATYASYGVVLLLATGALFRLPDVRGLSRRALRRTTRELARHSRGAHLSNILSFLNYRLSYYFLAALAGPQAVGVLSVGVALAEALWLVGRSAAQTQYVDLINAPDKTLRLPAFLRATRLTGLITLAGLLALLALPAPLLALVFGKDFAGARPIIAGLAPGILALSVGMLLSTWFVGLGHYAPSNRATGAGLLMTLVACVVLVPRFGAVGAALATSASHLTSTAALLWQFRRATGQGLRALLPRAADVWLA